MSSCLKLLVRQSLLQVPKHRSFSKRLASTVKLQTQELSVVWDDDVKLENSSQSEAVIRADVYPYVWLRDNCQCSTCYEQSAQQRLLNTLQLDVNVKPAKVTLENDQTGGKRSLQVTWSDGHQSCFEEHWLKPRSFTANEEESLINEDFKQFTYWGSDFNQTVHKFDFEELQRDKKTLLGLLTALSKEGLVLIQNGPDETNTSQLLDSGKLITEMIGVPVKATHYGSDFFVVENKPNANNVAYTPSRLLLHADLPYCYYSPQVQALHCFSKQEPAQEEEQTDDRVFNTFSDSFYVATLMKDQYPEYFKVLTETKVVFHDLGKDIIDFHMRTDRPVIELDFFGDIESVNINNHVRACYTHPVPATELKLWYEAYQKFYSMLYDNCTKLDTKQGQTIIFDNRRVLHGREGIVKHRRSLCGWYYDWDFVRSRMRCLRSEIEGQQ